MAVVSVAKHINTNVTNNTAHNNLLFILQGDLIQSISILYDETQQTATTAFSIQTIEWYTHRIALMYLYENYVPSNINKIINGKIHSLKAD